MTLKEEILNYPKLFNRNGYLHGNIVKNIKNTDLYNRIMNATSFLSKRSTFSGRVFCIINDITEPYKCIECGSTDIPIKTINGDHPQYCSYKCNGNGTLRKEKVKKTCIDRYGVNNPTYKHMSKNVLKKINDKKWLIEQHHNRKKTLEQIAKELDIWPQAVENSITKLNIEHKIYGAQSIPEQKIVNYIKDKYDTEILTSNRKIIYPLEIDIFLPEYNLGIEYSGKYWHSPEFIGSIKDWFYKHQNKINMCKIKNINLLYLWEDYLDHYALIDQAINGKVNNNLNEVLLKLYKQEIINE